MGSAYNVIAGNGAVIKGLKAATLFKEVIRVPARSKKQFGKIGALYREGKISRKTLEDFNKGVHPSKLPTRVKRKKK